MGKCCRLGNQRGGKLNIGVLAGKGAPFVNCDKTWKGDFCRKHEDGI